MSCFVISTWVTNKCLAVYHVELTLVMKRVPGFVFLSRQVELLGVKRQNKYKIKDFFYSDDTFLKPYHFQIYSIFFRLVQIDPRSGVLHAFLFRRQKKKYPFYNQSRRSNPFLNFSRDHLRSTLGITCGRGSFAVHFGDHLRSRDHLRSGITCGTVQNFCTPDHFVTTTSRETYCENDESLFPRTFASAPCTK